MIYEKGLLKAMKELYKSYGYSVANDNGTLWIIGEGWQVGLRVHCISKEIKFYAVRLAREQDLLPMEYGGRTVLRDGVWLVQESADYFVAVLSCKGAEEEAGKIGLLEQMDWRN